MESLFQFQSPFGKSESWNLWENFLNVLIEYEI